MPMKASALESFDVTPTDVLVVIYGIPSLEQILPIIWTEKQYRPSLPIRAVFVHEGSYTGFGHHHPLIDLATELFDEIFIPFGLGWMHWRKGYEENHKFLRMLRLSSKLSRLISRFWTVQALRQVNALLPKNRDNSLTIFAHDYLSDISHAKYVDSLCGSLAITVGHSSNINLGSDPKAHVEQRLNKSYFDEVLGYLTPARDITVFYEGMTGDLKLGSLTIKAPTIERFDEEWLAFVKSVHHEKMKKLVHDSAPIGLLISRPSAGQVYAPDPVKRVQALVEIRRIFEESGLTPVVILHPHEGLNKKELEGWVVVEDIHYSLLLDEAKHVVTFGTQLAEDLWRKGRKMIEYSFVWQGTFQSSFSQVGKTVTAKSPLELAKILREGNQETKI
jgi:hypothetical protein